MVYSIHMLFLSDSFHLLHCFVLLSCVSSGIPWCVYAHSYWRTFRLLPNLGFYKYSYEHSCTIFVRAHAFISLAEISRSWMNGSYSKYVFRFWRNSQAVFQSICANLHCQQWCVRVPVSSTSSTTQCS